ncbi:hypothetical protein E3V33_04670 [Candidatus Marinimicrobia bacterium MT.SAG.4]|nr:hypothetical protein E3V33_04670 [Candidatus Marinimicrobia bacterium MT.SAG.4]
MKTSRLHLRNLLLPITVVAMLFSVACDYAATTAPESAKTSTSVLGAATSLEGLNFLKWSPKSMEKLTALNKSTIATKTITVVAGGTVGGQKTFGNTVEIPAGALDDNTKISVQVTCMDGQNPCSAEVEFLPSQTFNTDVKITLDYDALGFEGDPYLIEIYFILEDGTGGEVVTYTVDEVNKTLVFYIDHFTRYGWVF